MYITWTIFSNLQARCDILEYVDAGKRPGVCKAMLFTDDDIQKLIDYETSLSKSVEYRYAYYPTDSTHDIDAPFVDLEKMNGTVINIRLPIDNHDWLVKYGWLPGHMDPETGFYFEGIEPFIPGLKCNESGFDSFRVYVEVVSGKPQLLYKEDVVPGYAIHQQKVKFNYQVNASPCPNEEVSHLLA